MRKFVINHYHLLRAKKRCHGLFLSNALTGQKTSAPLPSWLQVPELDKLISHDNTIKTNHILQRLSILTEVGGRKSKKIEIFCFHLIIMITIMIMIIIMIIIITTMIIIIITTVTIVK
jgi:hypothetical protein